jgi:hypothetical protein
MLTTDEDKDDDNDALGLADATSTRYLREHNFVECIYNDV